MKKIVTLVVGVLILITTSISLVGKDLPSVGYVLVGPKSDGGW